MLRKIYYQLGPVQRRIARRLFYLPIDTFDWITGRRKEYVPPRGRIFTGSGDYLQIGKSFFKTFVTEKLVNPGAHVLEIGSGMGRMAIPFIGYFSEGSYTGLEIVHSAVKWCLNNISKKNKEFSFIHADVANKLYVREARQSAENYSFPFDSSSFDFVFLTSVFTHMKPLEVQRYLIEIERLLVDGGSCLFTLFLLDDNSLSALESGSTKMKFDHKFDGFRSTSSRVLNSNLAFQQSLIEDYIRKANLEVHKVIAGWWRGGPKTETYQDIFIVKKAHETISI